MNPSNEDLDKIIEARLGRFDSPPPQSMVESKERTLQLLQSRATGMPQPETVSKLRLPHNGRRWLLVAAATLVLLASIPLLRSLVSPTDVFATVETTKGSVYGLKGGVPRELTIGEKVEPGTPIRTDRGATLKLSDGARIQMEAQSEVSIEAAQDGVRIRLNDGSVRVTPSTQPERNLYVQNNAVVVPVTGAVFQSATPASSEAREPVAPKRLEFEVISVRPSNMDQRTRPACRGVEGVFSASGPTGSMVAMNVAETIPKGRCVATSVSLANIISMAYDLPFSWRITNNADWRQFTNEAYQIEAKAENAATVTREELRQMLQSMLADRFKLKVHKEQKEVQGYALVVAKSGLTLKEATGAEEYLEPSSQMSPSRSLHGKFRMSTLAQLMTDYIGGGAEVADLTGLSGLYEVHLVLNRVGAAGGERTAQGPEPGTNLGVFDPPFFKAIEQQLGLRIESRKIPVDVVVIDHVERPTEN